MILGAACSGDDGTSCELPASTQYSCAPLPAGSYGCAGGPAYVSSRDGQSHQDDAGAVFPVGCAGHVPDCSGEYLGSLRTFQCVGDGTEPAAWSELL